MYSKCFRQLDLDDNLIGELGGFEIMRALSKRDQRMCLCVMLMLEDCIHPKGSLTVMSQKDIRLRSHVDS